MPQPVKPTRKIVLSGCSCGGKTTLVVEMAARGYATVPEPGRRILAEGGPYPWDDPAGFAKRALVMAEADFHAATAPLTLFDRSAPDAMVWHLRNGLALPNPALPDLLRYTTPVFLAPPWPEIFETDAGRRHGLEDAIGEYQALCDWLPRLGYGVEILPKLSLRSRADWLSARLGPCTPS